jgi:hypothetical protein
MGGTYGVEQSKVIVRAAAVLGNTVEKAIPVLISSGLLTKLKLLSLVMEAAPYFGALATINLDMFKKEVAELDAADQAALVAEFKAALDLTNDSLEVAVEEVVDVVGHAAGLVQGLVAQVIKLIDLIKR